MIAEFVCQFLTHKVLYPGAASSVIVRGGPEWAARHAKTKENPKPMIESDFKFWNAATQWWHAKAEEYLAIGDHAGVARCIERADLATNRRMESNGEILVWGPEIYARGA